MNCVLCSSEERYYCNVCYL
uniref:Uncharacterized protein n=1 Tax=Arundo donax TaxID=35708 RepID=A0A0A8ZE67_ARUDO